MDTTSLTAKGTARGEAVLLSGVFGVGKTTVCEELAARLEAAGRPYGAIDLDWLRWFGVPGLDPAEARRIHLENLRAVADAYALAGAVRLVIAGDEQLRHTSGTPPHSETCSVVLADAANSLGIRLVLR